MNKEIYLAGGVRTPIGVFCGVFEQTPAPALGSAVVKAALGRAGVPPDKIDEVIFGNVVGAGLGQNVARQVTIGAGLSPAVGATTINKVCGSGLKAVILAAQAIQCDDAAVVIAGGAENMSRLAMLKPAQGRPGVIDFVVKTVDEAGSNPCPPVIVGIGIGGTAEKSVLMAKHALTREVGQPSPGAEVAELEQELLMRINKLGIGPMGYGGRVTALAVHIEAFPAHMASLPVAVNLQCWCARHKEAVL